ncbi:phosphodiester glycosidase family protein [Xanthomonas fragariae]|uniref:phosphodiester glycosidase family protein n=1 Tax=Xanthomonas fragariae TaxID=48664 RepID=UPI000A35CF35|nr:phosphodiester glycosidase family protein [Xanthomonas fragariae]SMQ97052.1 hypothetical protein NBC2815_03737 [Xanthomonas fragariae]
MPAAGQGVTAEGLSIKGGRIDSAANLDGGGSSTLAACVDGRVRALNRPTHTGILKRERRSPTSSACASHRSPKGQANGGVPLVV